MFDKGDLFFLNGEGRSLFAHIQGQHGIIMAGPYLLYERLGSHPDQYYGYDILIDRTLFSKIPARFLERIVDNEKTPD